MIIPLPKSRTQPLNQLASAAVIFVYDVSCGIDSALQILHFFRDELLQAGLPDEHTGLIEWQLEQIRRSMEDFERRKEAALEDATPGRSVAP